MFRLRRTTDIAARVKNGQPPQSTTGVAKPSSSHGRSGLARSAWTAPRGTM